VANDPGTAAAGTTVPPDVLVVGAGEVADALAGFARILGWDLLVVESLEDAVAALPGCDTVVVLSHHEGVDGPVISAALETGPGYLGAMGSGKTQARRREWMLDHGVSREQLASVRTPVGLDLGANSPAEIAVSIVAEVLAVRNGGTGESLRGRIGPIHPALEPGTAECPTG
jgi:xanthine/CO dehydrogenase XdhC/CoxF family maturation factor